jgi:hypothetical protein
MNQERIKYGKWVWNFLSALVIFSVTDFIQTFYLVSKLGVDIEANPFIQYVISTAGFLGFFAIKMITLIIIAYFLVRWLWHPIDFYSKAYRKAIFFLAKGISFFYIIVILSNLFVMLKVTFL